MMFGCPPGVGCMPLGAAPISFDFSVVQSGITWPGRVGGSGGPLAPSPNPPGTLITPPVMITTTAPWYKTPLGIGALALGAFGIYHFFIAK